MTSRVKELRAVTADFCCTRHARATPGDLDGDCPVQSSTERSRPVTKSWMREDRRGLGESYERFDLGIEHELIETCDRMLRERRRAAVVLHRGLVDILLVDNDRVGITVDRIRYVADAAG